MNLSEVELKELWSRSDEYFQFTFDEYRSFGSRLKKWRELNHLTQRDIALSIYKARESMQLPLSTTDSLIKMYSKWENNDAGFDTVFSIENLRILKELLNVDYEFLFCECDTPHRRTKDISEQIALSIKTIEKLSSLNKAYDGENTPSIACYSYTMLSSLDAIISDDDLMCYLSYFLTHLFYEEDSSDEDFNSISVLKPINGASDSDSVMDGEAIDIDIQTQLSIFTTTIASKLCKLRDRITISTDTIPLLSEYTPTPTNVGNTFGERLRYIRRLRGLTQSEVAELLIDYRESYKLPALSKMSVLRTYQNWERKTDADKEFRISLQDLKMLNLCLECSYNFLLGDTDDYKDCGPTSIQALGLSEASYKKLSKYTSALSSRDDEVPAYASQVLSALDLIISDNDLLSDLTYFLSDIPYYPRLNFCSVLKPIDFEINSPADIAYLDKIFDDKELRNVFLPSICHHLISLREKNHWNHLPLKDNIDKTY